MKEMQEIQLYIQGKQHTVKVDNVSPSTSLNSYIRNTLQLMGTKGMCYIGGCGSCVVTLHQQDEQTGEHTYKSCLVPLLSCNGWDIQTIEGIGNAITGYHPVQQALANFNGTQCGFCSSGMVMNMYALYESGNVTMAEVENAFGGNICRCTGYRPILSAFKSLASDLEPQLLGQIPDIEDVKSCREDKCVKKCKSCPKLQKEPLLYVLADSIWIKVNTQAELLVALNEYVGSTYKLVGGNTAKGVYTSYGSAAQVYIDVSTVAELRVAELSNGKYILGASNTLATAIKVLQQGGSNPGFEYLTQLAANINWVANVPIRNVATLAGNLRIKHDNPEFPSDVFVFLETLGATVNILQLDGSLVEISLRDFLSYDLSYKVIQSLNFQPLSTTTKYVAYKIAPRAQNSHAYVGAGFLFKFTMDDVIESATIVYSNINPSFTHAVLSENILIGKHLFDNDTIQMVCSSLDVELMCSIAPPEASPVFRKQLAIALFYKAVLTIAPPEKVTSRNQSGGTSLERPISSGAQDYDTNESLYPVSQPIPKIEALNQTTGQAQYIFDLPDLPHQLIGGLLLAQTPAGSVIQSIDASAALAVDGVEGFYSSSDIPGDNNFIPSENTASWEEIFASSRILYYQQPIGILVGTSRAVVTSAINLIKVVYDLPTAAPLLSIRQILDSGSTERITRVANVTPSRRGDDIQSVITGKFDIYQQYHLHMETQNAYVVPSETGLEIFPGTQNMDQAQICVARMLNIPQNKITCKVRRLGGAFGAKISRNGIVSCAAALASWKLRKPVKLSMTLAENMAAIGKRYPFSADYEVGVNAIGVIQYLNINMYSDVGCIQQDPTDLIVDTFMANYVSDTFTLNVNTVLTDTAANTPARAPGSCEGIACIESILQHIAMTLGNDALEVKVANLSPESPLRIHTADLQTWANIDARKQDIASFNLNNRWKKKGLAVTAMTFNLGIFGPFSVTISIFRGDGSVQLSHGGIESGQGINTKAAQVCAYKLGIPLEKVAVLPSESFIAPNNPSTGGSVTSEAVAHAIILACDILNARIQPYRTENPDATWEELIKICNNAYVDLQASASSVPTDSTWSSYQIYGAAAAEVEVDILTGQYVLNRIDLIEDAGLSMSPLIDIGQVEGAFIMGLGYFLTEKFQFNYEGRVLTNNTWTYFNPGPKDIPVDFRVKFPKNNPNPVGVLNSKATAEPPLCLAIVVPLAIREAVASARIDSNTTALRWYPIDGVSSVENTFLNCTNSYTQYTL